jgi:hypothetical protein
METDFLTKLEKIASFANPWASFLFLLVTSFPSVIMLVVSVTRLQTSMAFLLQQRSYAILIGEFILAIFLMTTGDLLGGCFDPFGHFDSPGLHRIYELQFFYKSIWTNAEIVAIAFFLTACFLQIGVVLVLDGASENRRSAIVWFLFVLFSYMLAQQLSFALFLTIFYGVQPAALISNIWSLLPKAYPVDSGDLHNGPDKRLGRR